MTRKTLGFEAPPQLAIAVGATAPNPGFPGVQVWSTAAGAMLRWSGTQWDLAAGNGAPGGAAGAVQFNNAGALGGAANVTIDGGDIRISAGAPSAPAAGSVKIFGKTLGNTRVLPAAVGPSGMDYALQPALWRQKVGRWSPPGNSTTLPGVDGQAPYLTVGVATARNVATTSRLTRMRRLGFVGAAVAGSLASLRSGVAQHTTGTGFVDGGFFASFRFAVSDAAVVSGARMFVGMSSNTAAPTNAEPSALLNQFGVAALSTDATQLYLVYGGSAAQAAIPLGTSYPSQDVTVPYDLTLWCPPNANGVVNYSLENLKAGTTAAGTLTPATPGVQTPANTTLLNQVLWRCNNASALAVGLDVIGTYIETDN